MTRIAPRTTARLRLVAVTALAGVACTAVVGLGYASANGPASAQQYQYKVTICHHTGSQSNPHRTITVSSRALPAHDRHGDTVGPCPTSTNVTTHSTAPHVKKFHRGTTLSAELRAEKAKAKATKAKGKKAKADRGKAKGKGKGGGK
jgi:hypothetical protein